MPTGVDDVVFVAPGRVAVQHVGQFGIVVALCISSRSARAATSAISWRSSSARPFAPGGVISDRNCIDWAQSTMPRHTKCLGGIVDRAHGVEHQANQVGALGLEVDPGFADRDAAISHRDVDAPVVALRRSTPIGHPLACAAVRPPISPIWMRA